MSPTGLNALNCHPIPRGSPAESTDTVEKELGTTTLREQVSPVSPADSTFETRGGRTPLEFALAPPDGPVRVSYSTAIHLVHLFFDKIQPWMPIFHRPRFLKFCGQCLQPGEEDVLQHLDVEERLLFLGIFAMSARFSNSQLLASKRAPERGDEFAREARRIYDVARDIVEPTMRYLHGCILLAFYYYTSGLSAHGWVIVGVCTRLAYVLRLHEVDADPESDLQDPIELESRRRAWWLIWELDSYGSIVLQRPFAIDQRRCTTRLPVSDQAWFAGEITHSNLLSHEPGQMWKSLIGMGSHDERACFLVANVLLSHVVDCGQRKKGISLEEKISLETDVSSAKLALPANFDLDARPLKFNFDCSTRSNWIIGTHLLLAASACLVSTIPVREDEHPNPSAHMDVQSMAPESTGIGHMLQLRSIIHKWSPDHISLAQPFLAYALTPILGSEMSSVRSCPTYPSFRDLATLAQLRFAERWKVGDIAIRELYSLPLLIDLILALKLTTIEHDTEIGKLTAKPEALKEEEDLSFAKKYPLYFSSFYTPRPTASWAQEQHDLRSGNSKVPEDPVATLRSAAPDQPQDSSFINNPLLSSTLSSHELSSSLLASDFAVPDLPVNFYAAPWPIDGPMIS